MLNNIISVVKFDTIPMTQGILITGMLKKETRSNKYLTQVIPKNINKKYNSISLKTNPFKSVLKN